MNSIFFMRLFRLLTLLFVQVLIFNHIHLFGYITPLMMGYMVVCFHRNTSRSIALLWGFVTGLLFDMFNNTAGMAASACTLMAMIQPVLLNMMAPRDSADNLIPSFSTLGFWNYTLYVLLLMSVQHTVFYLLDAFTLVDWPLTLFSIIGGSLVATLITIFFEMLVRTRKHIPHHM